ncbi:MAG TPA: DUF86 domain-containing protein [Actinospica sp.]|nr:DUF86 domain-containing protein [Actinospica sp.]
MTGHRDYLDYLDDMVAAVTKARQFVGGMTFDELVADDRTIFAAIRALEIIGEASKRVPVVVRERHRSVPWRSMAGICDVVILEYDRVDLDVVWRTLQEDLPAIQPLLDQVVEAERQTGDSGVS